MAVVEHRAGTQPNLEYDDANRLRSERDHSAKLDQRREHDLDWMEAHPRGQIEIEVGVMHPMHPPERRYGVKHYVLEIDCQIEHNQRPDDFGNPRHRQAAQETPAAALGNE